MRQFAARAVPEPIDHPAVRNALIFALSGISVDSSSDQKYRIIRTPSATQEPGSVRSISFNALRVGSNLKLLRVQPRRDFSNHVDSLVWKQLARQNGKIADAKRVCKRSYPAAWKYSARERDDAKCFRDKFVSNI